ncbi:unnamed protein product, partial [Prorocentrum cordatum]
GVRPKWIFIFAILFTVVKSTFSYMLVLVASLGWGVTRPFLDHQVILKLQVLCLLYIVLDFIRESVLSFRHSYSLSLTFVLLCLLPVSLLNGAIFYWVFTALSSLMETLRERRQTEKLVLFQRLWKILIAALTLATCTLLFQIFNISRSITSRWKYQWLLTDGITHALFLFVLAAMMYLWAPHKYSQRFAYSHQLDGTDENTAGQGSGIWADEFGLEEDQDDRDDGESFWATTRRDAEDAEGFAERAVKARADVIGIAGGAAVVFSSAEVHRVLDVCHKACGEGVDVSCVPSCQDEVLACGTPSQRNAPCEKKAVDKAANFRATWEKEHPHSFMKVATSVLRKKVETGCEDACGPYADSHCFTECETMMFRCMCMEEDVDAKKSVCEQCESEVLAKAKNFDERYHTIA